MATWLLVTGAVFLELVVTFVAGALIHTASSGVCNAPATATALHRAQIGLVVLALAACLPWLLAIRTARYKLRIACFAVVAVATPILWMTMALLSSRTEWTSSWCF